MQTIKGVQCKQWILVNDVIPVTSSHSKTFANPRLRFYILQISSVVCFILYITTIETSLNIYKFWLFDLNKVIPFIFLFSALITLYLFLNAYQHVLLRMPKTVCLNLFVYLLLRSGHVFHKMISVSYCIMFFFCLRHSY